MKSLTIVFGECCNCQTRNMVLVLWCGGICGVCMEKRWLNSIYLNEFLASFIEDTKDESLKKSLGRAMEIADVTDAEFREMHSSDAPL